uniref:Uncharacterized protein T28D9.3 n=1 Tax=Lygus hesperus TaxID=30085 RepID=A0A0A9YB83_LYGHE
MISKRAEKNLDASLSFPSGHAAVSFFLFLYLSWYCQRKLKVVCSLTLLWIQTMLFLLACFVAISRITDHRHHWWDVLFGAIIGCAFAVFSALMLSKNFNWQTITMSAQPSETKVQQRDKKTPERPRSSTKLSTQAV